MALKETLVVFGIEVKRSDVAKFQLTFRKMRNTVFSFRNTVFALGAALGARVLGRAFADVVRATSAAAEDMNRLEVSFGSASGEVKSFAKNIAAATSQSRTGILRAAADMGQLIRPMVQTDQEAANLSKKAVALALDLSSIKDVKLDEALVAIRSGLVGQPRPLDRFGVNLRKRALEAFALKNGLDASNIELDRGKRASLALTSALSQLGKAGVLGDAERTAHELANALRGLDGAILDMKVTIGDQFRPELADLVFNTITPFIREITGPLARRMRSFVQFIKGTFRAFVPFERFLGSKEISTFSRRLAGASLALGGIASVMALINSRGVKFIATLIGVNAPMLITAATALLVAAAVFLLAEEFAAFGTDTEGVLKGLFEEFKALREETGSTEAALMKMIENAASGWDKFINKILEGPGAIRTALRELKELFNSLLIEPLKATFEIASNIGDPEALREAILNRSRQVRQTPGGGIREGATGIPGLIRSGAEAFDNFFGINQNAARATAGGGTAAAGAGGGTTVIAPTFNTTQELSLGLAGEPSKKEIAEAVAKRMREENEKERRHIVQELRLIGPDGTQAGQ